MTVSNSGNQMRLSPGSGCSAAAVPVGACPRANTSRNTLETIARWAREAGGRRVLDVPCGEGALLAMLEGTGLRVTGGDIQPELSPLTHLPRVKVNLEREWGFGDATFDTVICADGIEHVENPFHVAREARRILVPGGRLIISTPNIAAIRSRWRYLWSGFHNKFKLPLDEARRDPLHHINPLAFPELRYILHTTGFIIERVGTNRIKPASLPYAVLYPLVTLYTLLAFRRERSPAGRARNAQIFRHMVSPAVFLGETLLLQARKVD